MQLNGVQNEARGVDKSLTRIKEILEGENLEIHYPSWADLECVCAVRDLIDSLTTAYDAAKTQLQKYEDCRIAQQRGVGPAAIGIEIEANAKSEDESANTMTKHAGEIVAIALSRVIASVSRETQKWGEETAKRDARVAAIARLTFEEKLAQARQREAKYQKDGHYEFVLDQVHEAECRFFDAKEHEEEVKESAQAVNELCTKLKRATSDLVNVVVAGAEDADAEGEVQVRAPTP